MRMCKHNHDIEHRDPSYGDSICSTHPSMDTTSIGFSCQVLIMGEISHSHVIFWKEKCFVLGLLNQVLSIDHLTNDTFMLGLQMAHLDLNNWSMTLLSNLVWLVCSLFKKICTTGVEIGMPCFSVLTMAGGIMRV